MNRLKILTAILFFPLLLTSCEKIKAFMDKQSSDKVQTEEEKVSYLLGYVLTENIKKSESSLQNPAFLQGVKDSLENQTPALDQQEIENIHRQIQQKALLKKQKQKGKRNQMEGQKFLEENKNKEGVTVTASGLQYEVLTEGKGKQPTVEDTVEVHYRGTLINGTEFDSSYKRNASTSFPLNGVIKGWTEGLQLMKEGAKYKFYIPPELAYGERGAGQSIPSHATLIFEVELLKVK